MIDGALQAGGIDDGKKLLRSRPFLFVRLGPGGHVHIYVHCTILWKDVSVQASPKVASLE